MYIIKIFFKNFCLFLSIKFTKLPLFFFLPTFVYIYTKKLYIKIIILNIKNFNLALELAIESIVNLTTDLIFDFSLFCGAFKT